MTFPFYEFLFQCTAPSVVARGAILMHHAMTGHEHGHLVACHGRRNGTHRTGHAYALGQLAIRDGAAKGHLEQRRPHPLLERGALKVELKGLPLSPRERSEEHTSELQSRQYL